MRKMSKEHIDRCDKCGYETTDLDVGFCLSVLGMRCGCGGKWKVVEES